MSLLGPFMFKPSLPPHVHACVLLFIYTWDLYTHGYISGDLCVHICEWMMHAGVCSCVHSYMCMGWSVCICAYTCMCVYAWVCCMCVCMNVGVYVWAYAYSSNWSFKFSIMLCRMKFLLSKRCWSKHFLYFVNFYSILQDLNFFSETSNTLNPTANTISFTHLFISKLSAFATFKDGLGWDHRDEYVCNPCLQPPQI